MSDSPFSIARFGFFVSFVLFIAAGAYAYTLRNDLQSARTASATASATAADLERKLADAQKSAKTEADSAKSCNDRAAALQTQLDQKTAALAASPEPKTHRRK